MSPTFSDSSLPRTSWGSSAIVCRQLANNIRRPVVTFRNPERLPSPIRPTSSDNKVSGGSTFPDHRSPSGGSRGGDQEAFRKEGYRRTRPFNSFQGFLFPDFSSPEERHRRTQDDNRPENIEQEFPAEATEVPDGIHSGAEAGSKTRRLDGIARPKRCLSSHSNPSSVAEVPPLCCQRQVIPIQSSSVRDCSSSMAFHQGDSSYSQFSSCQGHQVSWLPGRLPVAESRSTGGTRTQRLHHQCVGTSRVHYPPGKIRLCTISESEIYRCRFRHEECQSSSTTGQTTERTRTHTVHAPVVTRSPIVDVPVGEADKSSRLDQQGTTDAPAPSMLGKLRALSRSFAEVLSSAGGDEVSSLVDKRSLHRTGRSFIPVPTRCFGRNRRFQSRMGSPLRRPNTSGQMVTEGESATHKPTRTVGHNKGAVSLAVSTPEEEHHDSVRQRDSGLVYQQAGRHQIVRDVISLPKSLRLGGQTSLSSQGQTHSGSFECSGRQSVPSRPNIVHRVDTASGDIQDGGDALGISDARPVRYSIEQSTAHICKSSSRSSRLRDRCYGDQLGRIGGLRLPTTSIDTSSLGEGPPSLLHHNSCGSSMAESTVVSRSACSDNSRTSTTARVSNSIKAAKVRQVSSKSRVPTSTRLEVIQSNLRESGFSAEVAHAVQGGLRSSTSSLYDCRYEKFVTWKLEFHPDTPISVPIVYEFLLFLRRVKKFKAGTIDGYRSALTSALSLQGVELSGNQVVHQLLRSFQLEDMRQPRFQLKWNLSVVLSALLLEPFEPLKKATLPFLSWKTAFLLALASASRVSELHALDLSSLTHSRNWSTISISTLPGFVAKNQKTVTGPLGRRCFSVPALSGSLSDGMERDLLLCPVRALKTYIESTKEFRRGRNRLFLPCLPTSDKDITKNTISAWLKKTIKAAYHKSASTPPVYGKVSPHEIRAWATSIPLWHSASVEDVISAGYWASSTTFTSFYLRDVQTDLEGLHQLGSFVAAGGVQSSRQ